MLSRVFIFASRLKAWFLCIVRVANSPPQAMIQLGAVKDYLSRMHGFYGVERDCEVASVLDVDHKLGPSAWSDSSHCSEFFATIRYEGLESHFDLLPHGSLL
jgi:hypothetical protein